MFGGPSDQYQPVPAAYPNVVHDSVMISPSDGDNLFQNCGTGGAHCPICPNDTAWPLVSNMRLYSPTASTTICGLPLQQWQALPGKKLLVNVTTAVLPPAATILQWAHAKLGMAGKD